MGLSWQNELLQIFSESQLSIPEALISQSTVIPKRPQQRFHQPRLRQLLRSILKENAIAFLLFTVIKIGELSFTKDVISELHVKLAFPLGSSRK